MLSIWCHRCRPLCRRDRLQRDNRDCIHIRNWFKSPIKLVFHDFVFKMLGMGMGIMKLNDETMLFFLFFFTLHVFQLLDIADCLSGVDVEPVTVTEVPQDVFGVEG